MMEEHPDNTHLPSQANNRTSSQTRCLHNFIFSSTLAWHHRVNRCVKPINGDNEKAESHSNPSKSDHKSTKSRPWNLRTRKANPSPDFKSSFRASPQPPATNTLSMHRGKRVCIDDVVYCNHKKFEEERRKFSIALKKEEIEEDFLRIKGVKPARRPKKRSRYIQKQIDSVFPGCFLSEITADLYKVRAERP